MKRLEPITYVQLKRWLKRNHFRMTVFTLGGNSYVIVMQLEDDSICITGSNGKSIRVSEPEWKQAMSFIKRIPLDADTWKAASYARPHVIFPTLAGNMNFGPSFPAICKAYWCYHKR